MQLSEVQKKQIIWGLATMQSDRARNGVVLTTSEQDQADSLIKLLAQSDAVVFVERSDAEHIIDVRIECGGPSWVIQHPLACRPHLFECKFNDAMELLAEEELIEGRFIATMTDIGIITLRAPISDWTDYQ